MCVCGGGVCVCVCVWERGGSEDGWVGYVYIHFN